MSDIPVIAFNTAAAMEEWLALHHTDQDGIWLQIAKKHSGISSVTYDEALDIALCFGWIDGQRKTYDENFFIQRFTPRRPRSLWSTRNVKKIAALTKAGRMRPSGLAQVEAAKLDGRWGRAYGNHEEMPVPADFLSALENNLAAKTTFDSLKKTERYQIAFRLTTAIRPETRQRRFKNILSMLKEGKFR